MNSKELNIGSKNIYKRHALDIFQAGIEAVKPDALIRNQLRIDNDWLIFSSQIAVAPQAFEKFNQKWLLSKFQRIFLIAIGKAASPMAAALAKILGKRLDSGIVLVKYGHTSDEDLKFFDEYNISFFEAAHPVPDSTGIEATKKILEMLEQVNENDLVIILISGGGSALLIQPVKDITLEEKQEVTRLLLSCGAEIKEINTIRKHLSQVKGGQLARKAAPSTLISFVLSDIVGDPLDAIASGPTVPDPTTFIDCLEILKKYDLSQKIPKSVKEYLTEGTSGKHPETPKINEKVFQKCSTYILGNNYIALSAAKKKAQELGYNTLLLSSLIEGDTEAAALFHSAIAHQIALSNEPILKPACVLSGGETTVILKGSGKGGRNQHFCLALVRPITDLGNILILSGGSDGNDGPTDAAGAIVDDSTFQRAQILGLNNKKFLEENDAYNFFLRLGDLLITGPTNTNVMDIRIMLIT